MQKTEGKKTAETGLPVDFGEEAIRLLGKLRKRLSQHRQICDAAQDALELLSASPGDLLYGMVYLKNGTEDLWELSAHHGLKEYPFARPAALHEEQYRQWNTNPQELAGVVHTPSIFGEDTEGSWPQSHNLAAVIPLNVPGQEEDGLFIAGIHANRTGSESYLRFLELAGGAVAGMVARLIAENRRSNRKTLEELKEELELSRLENRRKDEFIGITSHELRTPLTSLKTHIQLMLLNFKNYESDKIRDFLGKMDGFADQLNSRISDLLDVTRFDAGNIQYEFQQFNFQNMVMESVENSRHNTQDHQIIVKGEVENTFYGDRGRLQQVINNLLSNAVKYSPDGGTIVVELKEEADKLDITVTDTGLGIPEDQLDHIFSRYSRLDNGKKTAGLGLGLFISSKIVERHSGTIHATSSLGEGTAIHITLPKDP